MVLHTPTISGKGRVPCRFAEAIANAAHLIAILVGLMLVHTADTPSRVRCWPDSGAEVHSRTVRSTQ